MQLAHPKVPRGVTSTAAFNKAPSIGFGRTMSTIWSVVFAQRAQARLKTRYVHAKVRGAVLSGEPSGVPGGCAMDQELLLWVHAALGRLPAMIAYDLFVAPMTAPVRNAYYDDSKKLAYCLVLGKNALPISGRVRDVYESHDRWRYDCRRTHCKKACSRRSLRASMDF